jgi:hypothetical protein
LWSATPGNTQWQENLVISLMKLGEVQFRQKNVSGAKESFRRSLLMLWEIRDERGLTEQQKAWEAHLGKLLNTLAPIADSTP